MSELIKLQHYVPRFYLKAWAKSQKLCVLQEGKIYQTGVRNVAAQNYFYRLNELTTEDIDFVRTEFIEKSHEKLRAGHEYLLHAFTLPHQAKRRLELAGRVTPEFEQFFNEMTINANEKYHGSIERQFKPLLDAMIRGDLGFLDNTDQTVAFYHGLAVQVLRTNSPKRAKANLRPDQYELYQRTAGLIMQILAVNMGLKLWLERSESDIVLLQNDSEIPFITADQPIINLAANPTELNPPDDWDLYYPLCPKRAMILLMPNSKRLPVSLSVTAGEAHMYNLGIAAHANSQIFASEEGELAAVKAELPAYLSCFQKK